MASNAYLFTSESVTEGHPDKLSDQISDSVLDAVLAEDPNGRVACETLVTTGVVVLAGEITCNGWVDFGGVARAALKRIGYTKAEYGIGAETCAVFNAIDPQSPDIAMGVDTGGAGDQGLMFGYACRETEELMPLPIMLAHGLTRRLAELRHAGEVPWLRPDGKAQVTVRYEDGVPRQVHTVVVSTQHDPDVSNEEIRHVVRRDVIDAVIPESMRDDGLLIVHVNPTGRFVTGGPQGDCGLTGRKIIVDTYGGVGHHGGGAFSGKDATKVDRSASYMARHVAKNIVAAGLADRVEVQLAYAIGVAEPVSVHVDSRGTSPIGDRRLETLVREIFPLTPRGIIEHLQLRRPIFAKTAAYGHFGRNEPEFTWEHTNLVAELQRAAV